MDASKTISKQAADLRAMWRELWWTMAKGKPTEYEIIKATPVLEFWALFDLWKADISRQNEAMREKARRK